MSKNTPQLLSIVESLEKIVHENRSDLSGARLKRFLDEARSLRRNLNLRKQQQKLRAHKSED